MPELPDSAETVRILLLTANPLDTTRLQLDREASAIKTRIKQSKYRERFQLAHESAAGLSAIRQAMLEFAPHIVHFSGHGEGQGGLVVEDERGGAMLLDGGALAEFFSLFCADLRCVLLNACDSSVQAAPIARHVPYVIGMNRPVEDSAALAFSIAFYDALGAGKTIPFAYELACNHLKLAGEDHRAPVLHRQITALAAGCRYDVWLGQGDAWAAQVAGDWLAYLRKQLDGAEPAVCRAEDRAAGGPEILEQLHGSALFLYFRTAVADAASQAELGAFLQHAGAGRIIVVDADPAPRPPEFQPCAGARLWQPGGPDGARRLQPADGLSYYKQVSDLARATAEKLAAWTDEQAPPPATPSADVGGASSPVQPAIVFLADAPPDLLGQREDLKRYLAQFEITVIPEHPYFFPNDPLQLQAAIDADLSRALLYVELHSDAPAMPMYPGMSSAALQAERARAAKKTELHWQAGTHAVPGAVAGTLELFKNEARNTLNKLRQPPHQKPAAPAAERLVFVNTALDDRVLARQVAEVAGGFGLICSFPLEQGEPDEIRADLEDNLRDCDAMLLIYGESTVQWVRSQLRLSVKAIARRADKPRVVVCEIEPAPKDDLAMTLPAYASVLPPPNLPAQCLLQRFVERLGEGI